MSPGSSSAQEPRRKARRRALQALYQLQINPCEVRAILEQFYRAQDFGGVDRKWFETQVLAVAANPDELDARLADFLHRDARALDAIERIILRMAAWELLHHPEIPVAVVIDEAVDLSHRFGAEGGYAFVNAVLDRAAKAWAGCDGTTNEPS